MNIQENDVAKLDQQTSKVTFDNNENTVDRTPSVNSHSNDISSNSSDITEFEIDHDKEAVLKCGSHVTVKLPGENDWKEIELTKRAGKTTGRYKNSWNAKDMLSGEEKYYDLDRVEWKFPPAVNPELNPEMSNALIDSNALESSFLVYDATPAEYNLDDLQSSMEVSV